MKTYIIVIFSLITGLSFTTLTHAAGEIYRYKNSQGNVIYSDRKPNTEYEIIKGGKKKSNAQTTDAEESVKPPAPAPARSVEEVRTLTATIKTDIDGLYTQLVTKDNESQGKVTVNFTIAPAGKITHCAEDETEMNGSKFNGSICAKIKTLQFDAVENPDPVRLTFTYDFNPSR